MILNPLHRSEPSRFAPRALILIVGMTVTIPVLSTRAFCGTDRAVIDTQYRTDLEQLAAKCEQLGLKQQAEISRRWLLRRDPHRYYLFLPSSNDPPAPAADAPQLVKFWYEKFTEYRRAYANRLFELARQRAETGDEAAAYRLLYEVLREDPDHAQARRILGYTKATRDWSETSRKPRARRVRGQHPFLATSGGAYWRIDSEHFQITTDAGAAVGLQAAEYLERIHFAWRQLFVAYWSPPGQLAAALHAAKTLAAPTQKHQVVLFRSRDQYVRQLQRYEPQIGISSGYYSQDRAIAFFFAGDQSVRPNWAHETTHQLFQETQQVGREVGQQSNFWAIEAVAMYMESLAFHDSYSTTGGIDAERLQYARYRALNQHALRPLAELVTYGRDNLQHDPDVRQLYSQCAGLAHFFLHSEQGRRFSPFVKYLTATYRHTDAPKTLQRLMVTDLSELDRQYLTFLNVTDNDLAFVDPHCRKLCLGHTSVTDSGLKQLSGQNQLVWLDLSFTAVGDHGLSCFADCVHLNQLNLEKSRVTDASRDILRRFRELEELDLSQTAITDASLDAIADLSRLKILWLTGTSISDLGLKKLTRLKNLEQLEVEQTGVTADGRAAVARQLPKLKP